MLETLYYPDEVRTAELPAEPDVLVSQPELTMALSLVEMLTRTFDPKKYQDQYRVALLEMIEAKRNGSEIVADARGAAAQDGRPRWRRSKASLEAARKSKGDSRRRQPARTDGAKRAKLQGGRDSKAEPEETEELAVAF